MSKLFISGGTVIDPETLSRFQADVLCEDGRIAAIQPAQSGAPKDARVIDASGCFVCPGFIDPHGHIDGCFIPVNAPHAKNANLFLQYLLRPEVAATCAEWQYYCSPNEAAKACLSEIYLNNPVFNGIYDRIDDTEYVRNLSSEDEQKYQDIWTTFKLSMQ